MLTGKRILLAEDEALVAEMVAEMLAELGASVIGPAATVEEARGLALSAALDVAVLDINLRWERVDPVADLLASRGVPVVFATGYALAPMEARAMSVIHKPYTQAKLAAALERALKSPRSLD